MKIVLAILLLTLHSGKQELVWTEVPDTIEVCREASSASAKTCLSDHADKYRDAVSWCVEYEPRDAI